MNKPLIAIVVVIMLGVVIVTTPWHSAGDDARVYYDAAQRLAHHQPLYVTVARRNPYDVTNTFIYPPTFAALLRPAAWVSWKVFRFVWNMMLGSALFFLSIALTELFFGWRHTPAQRRLVQLGLLLTPGVMASVVVGNADIIVWALAAWALVKLTDGPLLAAAMVKVYPAPAWVVMMFRGHMPSRAIVLPSLLVIYTAIVVGGGIGEWWRHGVPTLTEGNFTFYNWSLSTLPLRFVAPGDRLLDPIFRHYLTISAMVAPCVFAWVFRKSGIREQAATVLLASTAFAPLCWWYRLPIGVVLVVAAIVADRRERC